MTRTLLVVECLSDIDAGVVEATVKSYSGVLGVHELPSAEELGRVAFEALPRTAFGTPTILAIGQAILAALIKGAQ